MKGFTLIETLILVLVFSLVMGAVFTFILMFYRTYGYIFAQSTAINEARRGIETMVKEIREARAGDDGSFPIEMAGDKEFIFYSDIDKDGAIERVRYFLGSASSAEQTNECVTFLDGGSCSVLFSDFLQGDLDSAEIRVSVEGDFGWSIENADIFADGEFLGTICNSGCSDCAGEWEGTQTFNVSEQAIDNSIQFTIDSSGSVNNFCDWQETNHSMKANFNFSFNEIISNQETNFKKGIINPIGIPAQYSLDQEEVSILSSYVRNSPPIFEYFDENEEKIIEYPARLKDTKLMKVFLIVDIDVNKDPSAFELESWTQLRNLKEH
ncbi:MAG: hypothetical protein ISS87_01265 [Candidatus Pacebacteria bacterium]|nr:hypothetical protein [Candidatus Paceibacterota bacterium]